MDFDIIVCSESLRAEFFGVTAGVRILFGIRGAGRNSIAVSAEFSEKIIPFQRMAGCAFRGTTVFITVFIKFVCHIITCLMALNLPNNS